MKHRGLKFLSLLLTLVMVIGLMPGMSLTAWADDPYASLKNTTTKITFDGKDWYLIDYDTTTVTLLSKECVGVSRYDTANPVNVANTWYTNNITATAKTAVNGSGMFLLTIEQVKEILGSEEVEASSDVLKCSVPTGADYATWWLCSPGLKDSSGVAIVLGSSGKLRSDGAAKSNMFGVRPALKLDLSKVTFDSTSNTFTVGAASYTVTYDANGGSGEMKPTKVEKNAEGKFMYKVESCGFTAPDGKTFDFWKGSDDKEYRVGGEYELTGDITLKAQWKDEEKKDGGEKKTSGGGSGFDLVFNIPGVDNSWEYVGGGYAPQQAYRVSLAPMQGGSAALGLTTGESGVQMNVYPTTTVYVFPNAAQGYVLDKIVWSLIDGSASYDITEAKNFVMPAMDVVVYVTFQPLAS